VVVLTLQPCWVRIWTLDLQNKCKPCTVGSWNVIMVIWLIPACQVVTVEHRMILLLCNQFQVSNWLLKIFRICIGDLRQFGVPLKFPVFDFLNSPDIKLWDRSRALILEKILPLNCIGSESRWLPLRLRVCRVSVKGSRLKLTKVKDELLWTFDVELVLGLWYPILLRKMMLIIILQRVILELIVDLNVGSKHN